jgi:hypothetical protein
MKNADLLRMNVALYPFMLFAACGYAFADEHEST